MDRDPKPGEIYRHFKNKLYQIIAVARHTETGEELVVYQALYGTFQVYARPLSMFLSEVDREKYPEVSQTYRFEKADRSGLAAPDRGRQGDSEAEKALSPGAESAEKPWNPGTMPESQEEAVSLSAVQGNPEKSDVNPLVLAFVEAKDYDVKLEILSAMEEKARREDMDILCEALDLPAGTGDVKEQMHSLKQYLRMRKKFDGGRLR